MRQPETPTSEACRVKLVLDLGLDPGDLHYIGKMVGPNYDLHLFNVVKFGHPLYGSTKSIRVEI